MQEASVIEAVLLLATAVGLALAVSAHVVGIRAVPGVVRTSLVGIALWGLCGWALTRALVRGPLAAWRLLLVLPIGAVSSSFALACLGLLHVPFDVSLAIVLAAALAAALRWRATQGGGHRAMPLGLPIVLAAVVGLISLIPVFRSGFETIPGQNGDAVLVAGSAVLVEHAPPTATRDELPINRIPLNWRSKYPVYYALAAVSTLAGQTPIQAFGPVSALVLAMAAFGLFLFALYALRAPPWVALAAVAVVPLDRILIYVVIHPYYNELWAQFTLPFMLLFGWLYLREPSRRSAALFAMFLVFGLLEYPLMVPFPLLFLGSFARTRWRRRHEPGQAPGWISGLRLPSLRGRAWLWIPIGVVAVPLVAVGLRGFVEKVGSAGQVLLPWSSLGGWSGGPLPFLPGGEFVGMPGHATADYVGLVLVCALAAFGLWQVRSELRRPMALMVVLTGLIGVYFRARSSGQLFYFKDLSFVGPYLLILALMGLAGLMARGRRLLTLAATGATAALLTVIPIGAGAEINQTYDQVTPSVLGLSAWDRALPRAASIRIDVPPSGWQLWAEYMLHDHPLTVLRPMKGFFPHPPQGRRADYIVTFRPSQGEPADAVGPPLFQNAEFQLWRMKPSVPGPDISRRGLLWDITKISF